MSKQNGKQKPKRTKAETAPENGALGGRPRKEMNWFEFDKLCEYGSTLEEIASWFECSADTIERRVQDDKGMGFAEYFAQKHIKTIASLRRRRIQRAFGDPANGVQPSDKLLIHMSEHELGLTSKLDVKLGGGLSLNSSGDPYADLIALLVELITNADTRNELNNFLKPHGIQLLADATAGKGIEGNGQR